MSSTHALRCAAVALAITLAAAAPSAVAAQDPIEGDRRLLLGVPGAAEVFVERNLPYKRAADGGAELRLDIYYPPDFQQDTALPVVVFMNGMGFPELKDFPQYVSWARATAANGMAAVTFESTQTGAEADIEDLMLYLRAHATTLGIDGDNMCWWACSDNVARSFPLALQDGRTYLRCAVLYYGMADRKFWGKIRDDLPLFLVKAGLDYPMLNTRIDNFVFQASQLNRDLTYVVYASGRHAFDVTDDTARTRAIIQDTLDFMRLHLSPSVQLEIEETALQREANAAYKNQDWSATANAYERVVAQQPDNGEAHFRLGFAQLFLGSLGPAISSFEHSIALEYRIAASSYNIGCAHARGGDRDQAFLWLDRAIEWGFDDHALLKSDPDLANLRSDERFAKVIERVGSKRSN